MRFIRWLPKALRREEPVLEAPAVIIAEALLVAIAGELHADSRKQHEGIVYLLGRTDGSVTVALAASHPEAITTRGSFEVSAVNMSRVVRAAADACLQVIGQLHTHPGPAFHSEGDVAGARIKYPGYVSIVVPDYGSALPGLEGSACYFYEAGHRFREMATDDVHIVPVTI